jgi:hypothetical protein
VSTVKVSASAGVGSDAVRLAGELQGLDETSVTAAHGQAILFLRREPE